VESERALPCPDVAWVNAVRLSGEKIIIIIIIIIIIFINSKWVDTRWQWLFYIYTKYDRQLDRGLACMYCSTEKV
jgi:hypothetical protein